MHMSNKFMLYGGDGAFADRQKKLFDQLSIAEKECNRGRNIDNTNVPMDIQPINVDEHHPLRMGRKRKNETRQFRGKESIFKRPEGPAPCNKSRSIPDHHRNPHKWVKYSLDDVSSDDMTDCSNARTAFAFLKELKARKAKENLESKRCSDSSMDCSDKDEPAGSQGISFKKPKQITSIKYQKPDTFDQKYRTPCDATVIIEHEEKPMFRSSKFVMPEYVVGQKQKKKDKEKRAAVRVKVDRTKELKLKHLQEFDEEDDQI
ncbi:protein TSSC4 [Neodiprion lecontei]|uniref:U5 small nuclear ribonucleoprotein TSSC4 n=1 Tax=Neodiprion lecontei TaxID=441921 RepID=A0A6J0B9Q3_NEOLC|nr:protein TSSC4 [Neodiprion lecontei]